MTAKNNILLSGIVGSTAYGLAHAGSDVDRLGMLAIFRSPCRGFAALVPAAPEEQAESNEWGQR
ncbi:hypothetical protein O3Q52_27155 [Streptomyces sp. ActVer]|uniref:hypothetical protein n=1 Tax=Streptomyces sp. ActVer TaxID=3014558 RepID=UPI0022B33B96|nr:hypothetical protein [Streptomyces sp. ActVer]MCZ4511792.1 hypothetical protein [Streptomyces sp. ActVer]